MEDPEFDSEFFGVDPNNTTALAQYVPEALKRADPVDSKQARINAVSDLLASAYAKASTLQLTPEELDQLRAEFPPEMVSNGAKGKQGLLYIQHIHLSDRLNDIIGIGQWALIKREITIDREGGTICFEGVMVIRGCYVTEAIGSARYQPGNKMTDYSDAIESAMSDCLSRCCKRLGIGSQVWDKAYCARWLAGAVERKRTAVPVAPEDESQEPETEAEPVVTDNRNEKWLRAAETEKKRLGKERFYAVLGSAGYSDAHEVLDRETQKKIFMAWTGTK